MNNDIIRECHKELRDKLRMEIPFLNNMVWDFYSMRSVFSLNINNYICVRINTAIFSDGGIISGYCEKKVFGEFHWDFKSRIETTLADQNWADMISEMVYKSVHNDLKKLLYEIPVECSQDIHRIMELRNKIEEQNV